MMLILPLLTVALAAGDGGAVPAGRDAGVFDVGPTGDAGGAQAGNGAGDAGRDAGSSTGAERDGRWDGGASDGAVAVAPPLPTGRLTGRVLAKGTREAIAGAALTVDITPAGETDGAGRFTVEVPCGSRNLAVQAPGFQPATLAVDACAAVEPLLLRLMPVEQGPSYVTVVRVKPTQPQIRLAPEELTRTPGTFGDPLRVIESLPGVATAAWPAPIYAVRGSNPGNTGFFLDGIRVPALFHLALGPSVIHPYLYGNLDFFPGGYPARYGRYVAGIVSADTRSPATDRIHAAVDLRLFDAGALVSVPLSGGGTVTAAARYSYTAGLVSLLNQDVRLGYWDYQLRAERRVGVVQLTLFAFGSHDDLAPKGADASTKELVLRFHRVSLRAAAPLGGGRVQASLTLGADHSKAPIADIVPLTVNALSAAPRLQVSRSMGPVDAALGFDGELSRYRPVTALVLPAGDWDLLKRRTAILLAGYASATIRAGGRLVLTPELRYDSYRVSGATRGDLGPRLTAQLKVTDALTVKVAGGRFSQLPSLPLQLPGADAFGLRLLGLQSSWQASAGVEAVPFDGLEVAVTGYIQRYVLTDLRDPTSIRPDPLAEDLLVRRDGLSYGVELLVRRPQRLPLHGWISYTLSNNLRAVGGGVVGPSDWDQRHIFNMIAGYRVGRNTLGGRVHLNTGRPYVTSYGVANEFQRLPTFYQLDLRAERRYVFDRFILDVYAELVNATMTRQVYSPNQSIRLILPSLGVRGEF